MKLKIISVGKIKSRPIQQIVDEYFDRLKHYLSVDIEIVRDDDKALAKIESADYLVVLDEGGEQMSSAQLSDFIVQHQNRGTRRVVMFIGGPDGVGDEMKGRANVLLSLGKMTFPHELVQAILLEQLYRACSIIRGEPYHRN